jgi:hypothetical protein
MTFQQSTPPQVKVRLSRRQCEFIWPGFRFLWSNLKPILDAGVLPPRRQPPQPYQIGSYERDVMKLYVELLDRLTPLWDSGQGHRLYLNAIDIAILILAVRITMAPIYGQWVHPPLNYRRASAKRLVRTLENHRKRARRAWTHSNAEQYAEMQERWHLFRGWLRRDVLPRPFRPPRVNGMRVHRWFIGKMVEQVKDELIGNGIDPPEDKQLRRFVRMMLRYHRRWRCPISLPDLCNGKPRTRLQAAIFVKKRLDKARFKSLSEKGQNHV